MDIRERAIGAGHFRRAAFAIALVAGLAAGCAVQQGPRGVQVGLDEAAVLGTQLAIFTLQDGSSATLRAYRHDARGTQYSIKLEKYLKVIDVGTAESMRFERAEQIDDRTVVVLTRYERNCVRTVLVAIKGSEVLAWTLNYHDCRSEPALRVEGDKLYLAYTKGQFVYQSGSVNKELVPLVQPAAAVPSSANADPTLPPPPPKLGANAGAVPAEAIKPAPKRATKGATKPTAAAVPKPVSAPPESKPLDFPAQEQRPVRIILD